jgi:hypothetical protein
MRQWGIYRQFICGHRISVNFFPRSTLRHRAARLPNNDQKPTLADYEPASATSG